MQDWGDDVSSRANSSHDSPLSSDAESESQDGEDIIVEDGVFSISPELSRTGDPESEAEVGEPVSSNISTADTDSVVGNTEDRTISVNLPRYC